MCLSIAYLLNDAGIKAPDVHQCSIKYALAAPSLPPASKEGAVQTYYEFSPRVLYTDTRGA